MTSRSDPLERLRVAAAEFGEALAELIRESRGDPKEIHATADLTVAELAAVFGKQPGTVRAWVERGVFLHAYKLPGKAPNRCEWRIPIQDIEAFKKRQQRQSPRWWQLSDEP